MPRAAGPTDPRRCRRGSSVPSTPTSPVASNAASASAHRRSSAGRTANVAALSAINDTTPPGAAHRHSAATNGSGAREVHQHAVTEHGGEPLPTGRLLGLLPGRLHQPDPAAHVLGFRVQPLLGLGQHRRRGIEEGDVVARAGPAAATGGPRPRRRPGPTPAARTGAAAAVVQDEGPHPSLHRGVGPLDERVGQRGPGVLRHAIILAAAPLHFRTVDKGADSSSPRCGLRRAESVADSVDICGALRCPRAGAGGRSAGG